ncbi:Uncharacterised protein [Chryseobacterium nakagawai]|uniref:Uncharacterized protein n=1 Tax=Chryseobacterium nakagawai TaxID=1241982 RepID=A0AAD0YIJ3_CHRNA|nr:hypothetical protein [Chryseobacterium nakagawai]AZA89278.1 hypothetical protein EG343_00840 [Chryseobacterium nakagawai]VEH20614.1 Uncharacterised protein [Chryseobacterium nakagawai]
MATYESLIKIKGSVGDLVFYTLNGKNVVRKKSGFNKTAFKKDPSYEKVRQNSSEFGHCSKTGKIIRNSLDLYLKETGDTLLYQSFAKLMTEIKNLDPVSERGKRTVENGVKTENGKKLLKAFQFGEIKNVWLEAERQDHTLHLKRNKMDRGTLITLKLDSEHYTVEKAEEDLFLNESPISFKKYFSDDDFVLYFMIMRNENNEISHMGFI